MTVTADVHDNYTLFNLFTWQYCADVFTIGMYHTMQRLLENRTKTTPICPLCYSEPIKTRYLACMCMHHPGRNIFHFLVAVQMDLSSSSDKPDFVSWINPATQSGASHSMGRNIQQLTCQSQAAMKPTPCYILAALDTQPWKDLYTMIMSTLFTWATLLLLQSLPGMYLPNSRPNNTIIHCAPKTTALGSTCSDTNTLFHNTPIIHFGSWHPLFTLITLFHHINDHYIHHWHRQCLAQWHSFYLQFTPSYNVYYYVIFIYMFLPVYIRQIPINPSFIYNTSLVPRPFLS